MCIVYVLPNRLVCPLGCKATCIGSETSCFILLVRSRFMSLGSAVSHKEIDVSHQSKAITTILSLNNCLSVFNKLLHYMYETLINM